jgi:hypothetical protein
VIAAAIVAHAHGPSHCAGKMPGMKFYVRATALLLGALFLSAAIAAGVELWREGNWLANPKLKPAAAWLTSAALFLAIGLKRRR